MPRAIWKFQLKIEDQQLIAMPEGAKILSAAEQAGTICLWAEVDFNALHTTNRNISIYGTGQLMPDNPGTFIGSVMLHGGALVFHIYESN